MLENLSSKVSTISANTQVVFTMKNFSALIAGILALFFGFYQLVVVPKIDHVERQLEKQYEQNQLFYQELGKINSAINTLNTSIELLNQAQKNSIYLDKPTDGQFEATYFIPYDTIDVSEFLVELNQTPRLDYAIP